MRCCSNLRMTYDVRLGVPAQRGKERQETPDRADEVGRSDHRPAPRRRRLRQGTTASVRASVHVHRLHEGRLVR